MLVSCSQGVRGCHILHTGSTQLSTVHSQDNRGDLSQYFLLNLEPAPAPADIALYFSSSRLGSAGGGGGGGGGYFRPAWLPTRLQTANDRNFLLVRNLQTGQQPIINQNISYQRMQIFLDESQCIIVQCDSVTV